MQYKRLSFAVLSALLSISLAPSVSYAVTVEAVQYDNDVFHPDYYPSNDLEQYSDKLVARHLHPIDDTAHDEKDYHLTVTGGKVWRIYAAAIGTQDEEDGEHDGTAVEDSVHIHTVSGNRIFVDGVKLNLNYTNAGKKMVAVVGGGLVAHGFAIDNHVTISNTKIHDVYGGLSHHGSANRNEVIINEGVEAGDYGTTNKYGVVWGGLVNDAADTHAQLDHADFNTVTINGSDNLYLGGVVGAEIRGKIDGTADGNVVTLNSGFVKFVYGGVINIGEALNNQVFIYGGKIVQQDGKDGYVIGGRVNNGEASNNRITITGGTIIGEIKGGQGTAKTDNNRITIKGSPDLTKAKLIGGTLSTGRGNTLNLFSKQKVLGVDGFQILNLHISSAESAGDVLLEMTGDSTKLVPDTEINVYIDKDAKPLVAGEKIYLLKNDKGILNSGDDSKPIDFVGSIYNENSLIDSRLGFFTEDLTNDQTIDVLGLTVIEPRVLRPQTQSLLKGNLSRLAFVNQGGDLATGDGMAALMDAAEINRHWFVAYQAGSNHYDTDAYIDLDGQSVMFGGSWSGDAWGGQLSLGAFFEAGWADYEMLDQFPNAASMLGEGETEYRGGGLLIHWDQDPKANHGWYAEASLRMGRADLTYKTFDWYPTFEYDVSGTYTSAHLGLGYRYRFDDGKSVDLFSKFFYSRQDGESFMIDSSSVEFDSLESMRWRVGANYRHRAFTTEGYLFDWQTALAYEHEFEAVARGHIDEFAIHSSELRGGTGLAQLSVTFAPSVESNTRVRAAVQAYTGTREGVTGQIRWTHKF